MLAVAAEHMPRRTKVYVSEPSWYERGLVGDTVVLRGLHEPDTIRRPRAAQLKVLGDGMGWDGMGWRAKEGRLGVGEMGKCALPSHGLFVCGHAPEQEGPILGLVELESPSHTADYRAPPHVP